jgi:hypothetical protein
MGKMIGKVRCLYAHSLADKTTRESYIVRVLCTKHIMMQQNIQLSLSSQHEAHVKQIKQSMLQYAAAIHSFWPDSTLNNQHSNWLHQPVCVIYSK